jgi:hypothetical protein
VTTVDTLYDALFAQFVRIRSVSARTCDYGSGGRGFESLPARNAPLIGPDGPIGGWQRTLRQRTNLAFTR